MIRRSASGDFLTAADLGNGLLPGRFLTNEIVGGVAQPRWKLVGLPVLASYVMPGAATVITGAAGYQDLGLYVVLTQDTDMEPGFQASDRYLFQAQIEAVNADASAHTLAWRLMRSIDGTSSYGFTPNVGRAAAARSMAQNVATEINMLGVDFIGVAPTSNVRYSLMPSVDYASPNSYITLTRLSLVVTRIRMA